MKPIKDKLYIHRENFYKNNFITFNITSDEIWQQIRKSMMIHDEISRELCNKLIFAMHDELPIQGIYTI